MALIDRLTADDDTKIGAHAFGAAMVLLAAGKLTVNQIKTAFAMDVADAAQFDAMVTAAQLSLDVFKYAQRAEAVVELIETGYLTKNQASNMLDI